MGAAREARACEQCSSRIPAREIDTSPWPRFGPDVVASGGVGLCWRQDENVKDGGSACGDFAIGLDLQFAGRLRLTSELIAVLTEHVVAGSPAHGTSYVGGGTYFGTRLLFGFDFTRLFFGRTGAELRTTGDTATTFAWVFELGTRILGHVEVGLRAKVGFDAVGAHTFIDVGREGGSIAFAQATGLFLRVFP